MYSKDEIKDICMEVIKELVEKREKMDERDSLVELLLTSEDLAFLSELIKKLDK